MCNRACRSSDLLGRPVLDVVVELVDLVVQSVDQIEVVLGDLVHEVVRDHSGVVDSATRASLVDAGRVERLSTVRRLARGQHELARQDQVDLLVVDAVFVPHRDRNEEDAEDVVAVTLEGRPRLVLVLCRREQPVEGTRMEPLRRLLAQLCFVGIDEVDPPGRHGPS
jgi:hypothetical protein